MRCRPPRRQRGQAFTEYGYILTIVSVAAIGVLLLLGGAILTHYTTTGEQVEPALQSSPVPTP